MKPLISLFLFLICLPYSGFNQTHTFGYSSNDSIGSSGIVVLQSGDLINLRGPWHSQQYLVKIDTAGREIWRKETPKGYLNSKIQPAGANEFYWCATEIKSQTNDTILHLALLDSSANPVWSRKLIGNFDGTTVALTGNEKGVALSFSGNWNVSPQFIALNVWKRNGTLNWQKFIQPTHTQYYFNSNAFLDTNLNLITYYVDSLYHVMGMYDSLGVKKWMKDVTFWVHKGIWADGVNRIYLGAFQDGLLKMDYQGNYGTSLPSLTGAILGSIHHIEEIGPQKLLISGADHGDAHMPSYDPWVMIWNTAVDSIEQRSHRGDFAINTPDKGVVLANRSSEKIHRTNRQFRNSCPVNQWIPRTALFSISASSVFNPSYLTSWPVTVNIPDTFKSVARLGTVICAHRIDTCKNTFGTATDTACDRYSFGSKILTQTGNYTQTLLNQDGCDSTIQLNLHIKHSSLFSDSITSCGSITSPSGKYKWVTSGFYQDTLSNANAVGCDSILQYQVQINYGSTNTIYDTGCYFLTSPSGKYSWSHPGTYSDTLMAQNGCDSLLLIHVALIPLDTVVSRPQPNQLKARLSGAKYRWMRCDTNQQLPNAQGQSYTPPDTGWYQVEITHRRCVDSSQCWRIPAKDIWLGQVPIAPRPDASLRVFPNPSSGKVTIQFTEAPENHKLTVWDAQGRRIDVPPPAPDQREWRLDLSFLPKGLYWVTWGYESRVPLLITHPN